MFILYEGFNLLAEEYVVIPGVFRMIDSIFIILPIFAIFFSRQILGAFRRFGENSRLTLAACALVLIGPLMAQFVFGQPYMTGIMLMRHNLCYLCFFIFIVLFRPDEQMEKTIRFITFIMCIYVVLLILTQRYHQLGLIHFREGYYGGGGFERFGHSRLYFPDGSLFILFYCISLARLLHLRKGEKLLKRYPDIGLVLLVMYALLASYTRILVFSVLLVTAIALISAKSGAVRNVAIIITFLIVAIQSLAMSTGGSIPFIENSKLGQMVLQSNNLAKESGRNMQWEMYAKFFPKVSPHRGGKPCQRQVRCLEYQLQPHLQKIWLLQCYRPRIRQNCCREWTCGFGLGSLDLFLFLSAESGSAFKCG